MPYIADENGLAVWVEAGDPRLQTSTIQGQSGAYDSTASSTSTPPMTGTTSGARTYSEGEVAAWFEQMGAPLETPYETETQRLQRITQQLNSGQRTEEEVKYAISQTAAEGWQWQEDAPPMYGGQGGALLQEAVGANAPIWLDSSTGIYYLAYLVPGTEPPVPLLYSISSPQLKELFPDGQVQADRTVTTEQLTQMGGIFAGNAEDPKGDPYMAFIDQIEREAEIFPWLKDPDMLAITFEAALEGRPVSDRELMQTAWWKTHNESERAWLTLSHGDPLTAQQMIESARLDTIALLEQSGMSQPPDDMVNWLAGRRITGEWSDEQYRNQIRAISDPQSGIAVDPDLAGVIAGRQLDTIMVYEDQVRREVARWLGPLYGNWSDSQISHWAGRFRNDVDAAEELANVLRGQRMALFPEYENPQLTYEDIAAPWRQLVNQQWGQMPDETEPIFSQVMRLNDYAEAGKLLRSEGLNRGIGTVTQNLEGAALAAGGQIRRSF